MTQMNRPHYGADPVSKVRILEMPAGEKATRADCKAANIPADGKAGYEPGCVLRVKDGSGGSVLYVNTGTVTSCAFRAQLVDALTNTGFIPLALDRFRAIASNDIAATAGTPPGGLLASNSSPKYLRVNAATDKCLRIVWAATTAIEITQGFYYPPDMDVTKPYTVNLRAQMGASSDTPTIAIGVFESDGDTNRGGTTAALSNTRATLSVTVTPTAAPPAFASISLTPGAHGTDDMWLYEAYVTYSRKLLV